MLRSPLGIDASYFKFDTGNLSFLNRSDNHISKDNNYVESSSPKKSHKNRPKSPSKRPKSASPILKRQTVTKDPLNCSKLLDKDQIQSLTNEEIQKLLAGERIENDKSTFPYLKKGGGMKSYGDIDYSTTPELTTKYIREYNNKNKSKEEAFTNSLKQLKESLRIETDS